MAIFPKIQSPCPFKSQLAVLMDGDICRACKRQVFDLTDMGDDQRLAFMGDCTGEVCVSYGLPAAAVAAALVLAGAATPLAAAAQDAPSVDIVAEFVIMVGGITDPGQVEYIDAAAERALPELPVVYEDEPRGKPVAAPSGAAVDPRPGS